jgi:hypothetical protein
MTKLSKKEKERLKVYLKKHLENNALVIEVH